MVKIRIETTYIAQNGYGETVIPIGTHARLVFLDGSYHCGDIEKITAERVTISRSDGKYTYHAGEIRDIEI